MSTIINSIPTKYFKSNIIFLKLVGGGSLLIAAPTIYAIRKKNPNYKIILYCSDSVEPFARNLGIFDKIICIRTNNFYGFILSIIKSVRYVLFSEFIVNLEIHSKLTSLFCLWAIAKRRISLYSAYNQFQKGLINIPIFISPYNPIYESYKNISDVLNSERVSHEEFKIHFRKYNSLHVEVIKNQIIIAPFCSDIYPERELLPDHVVKIILDEYDISKNKFIILGGKKDIEKSRTLHNFLIKAGVSVENKVGLTSLDDVINLFNTSQFLLTIDSGLIHLARLVGIKTLSYWGPSDPTTRLDGSLDGDKFYYKRISCSPCVHTLDIAPCNGNNLCMQQYFNPLPKAIFWKIK